MFSGWRLPRIDLTDENSLAGWLSFTDLLLKFDR